METVIWKSCDNCGDRGDFGPSGCKGGITSGCWLADASVHREISRCFDEKTTAVGFKIVPVFYEPKSKLVKTGELVMYDAPKDVPGMNKKAVGEINGLPLFPVNDGVENSDTAVKFDNDKPRTDLMPPEAILGLADLYAVGARKYADRNWEKGMSYTRLLGALLRHALAYMSGENYAPDDKQHHMLSVAWCAFALFTYDCRGLAPEWDDRPDSQACPAAVAEVANLNNRR